MCETSSRAERHISVLLHEALDGLGCENPGMFLDATVGCGGHSAAIVARHPDNRLIGVDQDEVALQIARERLQEFGDRVTLYHARHEAFDRVALEWAQAHGIEAPKFQGMLFDLGVSSVQFDDAERGFSFQRSGWLDMRMDASTLPESGALTAYQVVNMYEEKALADVFFRYGEERQSRRIARKIVEARAAAPIETTTQLAEIVDRAIPKKFQQKGIHPATRVFQAIRIEVNGELRELGDTLERAVAFLAPGGRLCVISFHSLEDRIVKQTFARLAKGCECPPSCPVCICGKTPQIALVSKKPVTPSEEEVRLNPRSRSAKLRIVERL
ncbi:ribosomal RNA small subunit methyltransferase H [Candidatus Moduliflexus flocculans]|uniref:Ribosomal RNA small subunit methyltransferase H n=1 Tax=Candidatus Moduliflexus flocculans TaxID=1499966 RepID=A0A0S6VT79_9BACT|nr:ribosomal RNA small subunit methyltransferase H [Candidatus Moduliflexus flocculans]